MLRTIASKSTQCPATVRRTVGFRRQNFALRAAYPDIARGFVVARRVVRPTPLSAPHLRQLFRQRSSRQGFCPSQATSSGARRAPVWRTCLLGDSAKLARRGHEWSVSRWLTMSGGAPTATGACCASALAGRRGAIAATRTREVTRPTRPCGGRAPSHPSHLFNRGLGGLCGAGNVAGMAGRNWQNIPAFEIATKNGVPAYRLPRDRRAKARSVGRSLP
jgi:hypothetical protein